MTTQDPNHWTSRDYIFLDLSFVPSRFCIVLGRISHVSLIKFEFFAVSGPGTTSTESSISTISTVVITSYMGLHLLKLSNSVFSHTGLISRFPIVLCSWHSCIRQRRHRTISSVTLDGVAQLSRTNWFRICVLDLRKLSSFQHTSRIIEVWFSFWFGKIWEIWISNKFLDETDAGRQDT